MALIGFIGALALVTVAFIWATVKLTIAGGADYLQALTPFYRSFLGVSVLWMLLDYGVLQGFAGSIVHVLSEAASLVT